MEYNIHSLTYILIWIGATIFALLFLSENVRIICRDILSFLKTIHKDTYFWFFGILGILALFCFLSFLTPSVDHEALEQYMQELKANEQVRKKEWQERCAGYIPYSLQKTCDWYAQKYPDFYDK